MESLKPCPFCGGNADICTDFHLIGNEYIPVKYIRCEGCGARTGLWLDDDEAIKAWNRRDDNGKAD